MKDDTNYSINGVTKLSQWPETIVNCRTLRWCSPDAEAGTSLGAWQWVDSEFKPTSQLGDQVVRKPETPGEGAFGLFTTGCVGESIAFNVRPTLWFRNCTEVLHLLNTDLIPSSLLMLFQLTKGILLHHLTYIDMLCVLVIQSCLTLQQPHGL